MNKDGRCNIFEMYTANGHCADFFVHHEGWQSGTVARIVAVGGRHLGPLRGKPPYFNNPRVSMEIAYEKALLRVAHPGFLKSPGTYRYARVHKPDWWPL